MQATKTETLVRWMISTDFGRVLDIEHRAFDQPWTEEDFTKVLMQRNCIGMVTVLESDPTSGPIFGYMIYELHKTSLRLLNFAVDFEHRRQGIGRGMVEKLKRKLTDNRRNKITLEVRESNVEAQLFFRSTGFLATSVVWGRFANGEDAYTMELRL